MANLLARIIPVEAISCLADFLGRCDNLLYDTQECRSTHNLQVSDTLSAFETGYLQVFTAWASVLRTPIHALLSRLHSISSAETRVCLTTNTLCETVCVRMLFGAYCVGERTVFRIRDNTFENSTRLFFRKNAQQLDCIVYQITLRQLFTCAAHANSRKENVQYQCDHMTIFRRTCMRKEYQNCIQCTILRPLLD